MCEREGRKLMNTLADILRTSSSSNGVFMGNGGKTGEKQGKSGKIAGLPEVDALCDWTVSDWGAGNANGDIVSAVQFALEAA